MTYRINITVSDERAEQIRDLFSRRPDDVLAIVGALLVRQARDAFDEQEFGGSQWPERYPNQQDGKINIAGMIRDLQHGTNVNSSRFEARPVGTDSGDLRNSLYAKVEGGTLRLGSTVEYASTFHDGGTQAIPLDRQTIMNLYAFMKQWAAQRRAQTTERMFHEVLDLETVDAQVQEALALNELEAPDLLELLLAAEAQQELVDARRDRALSSEIAHRTAWAWRFPLDMIGLAGEGIREQVVADPLGQAAQLEEWAQGARFARTEPAVTRLYDDWDWDQTITGPMVPPALRVRSQNANRSTSRQHGLGFLFHLYRQGLPYEVTMPGRQFFGLTERIERELGEQLSQLLIDDAAGRVGALAAEQRAIYFGPSVFGPDYALETGGRRNTPEQYDLEFNTPYEGLP